MFGLQVDSVIAMHDVSGDVPPVPLDDDDAVDDDDDNKDVGDEDGDV